MPQKNKGQPKYTVEPKETGEKEEGPIKLQAGEAAYS